jgi:hypothetical protein
MAVGGGTTLTLIVIGVPLWGGLDANIFGLGGSLLSFLLLQRLDRQTGVRGTALKGGQR